MISKKVKEQPLKNLKEKSEWGYTQSSDDSGGTINTQSSDDSGGTIKIQ